MAAARNMHLPLSQRTVMNESLEEDM